MRPVTFDPRTLRKHLLQHKIATLPELKQVLGTSSGVTVFRKLRETGYFSSYTHRGRYYTLKEIPRFDDTGLWSHQAVWFSQRGSLVSTAEYLVNRSDRGLLASEIADLAHAEVQDVLRQLVQAGRVRRDESIGGYLYTSSDPIAHRRQLSARRTEQAVPVATHAADLRVSPTELQAGVLLFYSLLDEQQRRLFAGLESIRLGHGGDTLLADFLGLEPHTVARGRQQLLEGNIAGPGRTRRAGGGRIATEKKRPK